MLLRKYDFYFLEIRFLLFHANKLSPLNKKFNGKKYAKFVISRVFFYLIYFKFLPKDSSYIQVIDFTYYKA